jgi:hypothetical protein
VALTSVYFWPLRDCWLERWIALLAHCAATAGAINLLAGTALLAGDESQRTAAPLHWYSALLAHGAALLALERWITFLARCITALLLAVSGAAAALALDDDNLPSTLRPPRR